MIISSTLNFFHSLSLSLVIEFSNRVQQHRRRKYMKNFFHQLFWYFPGWLKKLLCAHRYAFIHSIITTRALFGMSISLSHFAQIIVETFSLSKSTKCENY